MATYGSSLAKLAVGISVGSEDLYRVSPTGVANSAGVGAQPADIINYIKQVRDVLAGTPLSGVSVGHVDTWTAWVDGGNQGVINACDFIGVDAYPYFQNTMANGISNGKKLMDDAVSATQAAVGGKPVWITETGFPVSGKTSGDATPLARRRVRRTGTRSAARCLARPTSGGTRCRIPRPTRPTRASASSAPP